MYNGTIGGIGEGLQSFVQAYQTALNYQLEKAKAAALTDYQQQMGDAASQNAATEAAKEQDEAKYQTGMLGVSGQNAATERANSRVKYLELGPGVAEYYAPGLMDEGMSKPEMPDTSQQQVPTAAPNPPQQQVPTATPNPPAPPPQGLINALPPGSGPESSGPQPSPGMIAASQARAAQLPSVGPPPPPGLIAQQSPPVNPAGPAPGGPPRLYYPGERAAMLAAKDTAAKMTAESAAKGENDIFGVDPTNPTTYKLISPGIRTGEALTAKQTKEAELKNAISGSRSSLETVQKDFSSNPQVSAVRTSKNFMDQMQDVIDNPTPQSQAAARLLALKIRFPNQVPDVGSLEELKDSESVPVQIRNAAAQAMTGLNDPSVTRNLARDAISSYLSNYQGAKQARGDYVDKATGLYGQSPKQAQLIVKDTGVDATAFNASKLRNQLGPYETPQQQGDTWKNAWGAFTQGNSNASTPQAHPMTGSTITYKGKQYNVAPNGNMTPVGQ